ncbi:CAAX amino terminal protease self- immunity [Clostridium homopropionicum DSM 5847]|uniref:CAAX amino terminal protease self-immunity n=1 Tax=Clostridium homopropionicum DSM 5847 TaxID=1121318 RepID=A0A0L6Z8L1_9CLOT|nr:type II CAAX endopeptidase family protein [Clostridium homopropionicum]KOA19306.1 CAAX amino terminal protease self- immunity [Clostridium homopropionicum DSM 5847]SFG20532.1 CAAX protease self-immunity [Clostridium homopropionicum]
MISTSKKHWIFFLITFSWSWILLLIPIILGLSYKEPVTQIFFFTAGASPSIIGIIMAGQSTNKAYWKDFWRRIFNFRQISGKWYVFIFGIIPVTSGIAILLNFLYDGTLPDFNTIQYYLLNPLQLLPFAVFMLVFGPIAEEIGWRGYALDHLEKKHGWISSSMILGFFWSIWHLPMFFIQGTYQNDLLNQSIFLFIDFYVAIFAASVIMDWVYNHNGKSILAGILVHFCINFFGELFELPERTMYLRTVTQIAVAVLIIKHYIMKEIT